MIDANAAMEPLHYRMPVFLFPTEWDAWLKGSFEDLLAFPQRKFPDEPIEKERTPALRVKKKTATARDQMQGRGELQVRCIARDHGGLRRDLSWSLDCLVRIMRLPIAVLSVPVVASDQNFTSITSVAPR